MIWCVIFQAFPSTSRFIYANSQPFWIVDRIRRHRALTQCFSETKPTRSCIVNGRIEGYGS